MTRHTPDATHERFAARTAGLSHESFVDFCEALWVARGGTVQRADDRLVVTRGTERETLLVWTPPRPLGRVAQWVRRDANEHRESEVDAVLTPVGGRAVERIAASHGARLVGPTTLANLLLYGVDRGAADDLSRRFFGVETSELVGDPASERRGDSADPTTSPAGWVAALTVAAACCLVVAAVLAGVWVPSDGASSVDDTAPPLLTGAGVEPPSGAGANDSAGEGTSDDGVPTRHSFPPGVREDSIDVDTLAAAHAAAVDGESYRLVIRQSGTDGLEGERHWRGAWEHAVVEDDDTWLYTVVGYEHHENGSRLVQYTAYADGDVVYQRGDTRDGAVYDRTSAPVATRDGESPHTARVSRQLRRYLATSDVEVDRPTWRPETYRLVATGRPAAIEGRVSNYTATALVNESGFVSELTVEYTRHEAGETARVRFRLEYAAVGETRVRPPGWLDEAQEATALDGTENATTTNATARDGTANATATAA